MTMKKNLLFAGALMMASLSMMAQLKVAGIVGNGCDVGKNLAQARVEEPLVGLLLKRQQVRHLHDLLVSGEILAKGLAIHLVFGHFALHAFLFFKPCPLEGMYCGGSIQFDTPGFVVKQSELHLAFFAALCYSFGNGWGIVLTFSRL